jgi:hypothetical protein
VAGAGDIKKAPLSLEEGTMAAKKKTKKKR